MSQVDQIREDHSESMTNLQNSDLITHEHVFHAFVLNYHNENFLDALASLKTMLVIK